MYYEEKTAEKPEKWPANAREQILDTLCECVEEFKKNPSYKTRVHIPQELRIRSRGTERHSASN